MKGCIIAKTFHSKHEMYSCTIYVLKRCNTYCTQILPCLCRLIFRDIRKSIQVTLLVKLRSQSTLNRENSMQPNISRPGRFCGCNNFRINVLKLQPLFIRNIPRHPHVSCLTDDCAETHFLANLCRF